MSALTALEEFVKIQNVLQVPSTQPSPALPEKRLWIGKCLGYTKRPEAAGTPTAAEKLKTEKRT